MEHSDGNSNSESKLYMNVPKNETKQKQNLLLPTSIYLQFHSHTPSKPELASSPSIFFHFLFWMIIFGVAKKKVCLPVTNHNVKALTPTSSLSHPFFMPHFLTLITVTVKWLHRFTERTSYKKRVKSYTNNTEKNQLKWVHYWKRLTISTASMINSVNSQVQQKQYLAVPNVQSWMGDQHAVWTRQTMYWRCCY